MSPSPLTHDQANAAEAAFRGLPLDLRWSISAVAVYHGIVAVTNGQDIVAETIMNPEFPDTAVIAA